MAKKTIYTSYILIIVAMAAATVIEKHEGTGFVMERIYGAWWFTLLWAVLAAAGIAWIVRRRVRQPSTLALHAALLLILAGALLTSTTAERGMVHLRQGRITDTLYVDLGPEGVATRTLPFKLRLDSFTVECHEGTGAPADYRSQLTIIDGGSELQATVSMNNIATHRSVRLCQSSYDDDLGGSILSVAADPWGIAVTYTGYALLFISLVWMLADPRATFRRLLRSTSLRRGALAVATLAALVPATGHAATTLPRDRAGDLGRLCVLWNGRICPLQTLATDFTMKLHGSRTYRGLTAEQVLAGWIFWGEEWCAEPFVKLKDGELREALQLPRYVSVNTLLNPDMGGYILGPYIREYYQGNHDAFHRQAADIDDKLRLVMELRRGLLLKVFPYTHGGNTTWYAPTDRIPDSIGRGRKLYMQNAFSLLYGEVLAGRTARADSLLGKMAAYQRQQGGASLPTGLQLWAERTYNAVPFVDALFMACLAMGLLALIAEVMRLGKPARATASARRRGRLWRRVCLGAMAAAFAALTFCGALRWVASGNIPMSNGYETMLLMAWFVMLMSMVAARRFSMALTLGFITAGFFLLVAHIGQMDPAITGIMPVLDSPLLSLHVAAVMLAFALLALTFACGVAALAAAAARRLRGFGGAGGQEAALQLLSRLLLYPALAALAMGTFIGAVWANVSWGRYWGWDAKETWALITLMVYAVAVHTDTIPALRRPLCYHAFMVAAFLTILMTYFGVNYLLGSGLHTYA